MRSILTIHLMRQELPVTGETLQKNYLSSASFFIFKFDIAKKKKRKTVFCA